MNVSSVILHLQQEQARYALESLRMPGDKDPAYAFGHRCGYVAGLQAAISLMMRIDEEEKDLEKLL